MKLKYFVASLGLFIALAPALNAQDTDKNQGQAKNKKGKFLAKFDVNHNGILDPSEEAALDKFKAEKKAERLAKYDKNGDGKLDKTEREALKADHQGKGKGKHQQALTTGTTEAPKQ